MEDCNEDVYLQKLQETVEDKDEIVTVSSFANAQNISVKDSLKILTKYLEDNKKLQPDLLAATYVLIGKVKNGTGTVVCLVKDCDIEKKKKEFEEITSEILYSIQKSKNIDFNLLTLVDWPNLTNVHEKSKQLLGTVKSKNATKRVLHFKKLPPPPVPTVKGKSSFFQPKTDSNKTNANGVDSEGKSPLKSEKNSNNKNVENKKEAAKSTEDKKTISKEKSGKGSLSSFFTKKSSQSSSCESIKNVENHQAKNNGKKSDSQEDGDAKQTQDVDMSFEECDFSGDMKESENNSVEEKPKKTARSPIRKDNSPKRKDNSPKRKDNSPMRKDNSHKRKDNSPKRKDNSPNRTDNSHKRNDNSSKRKDNSPKRKDSKRKSTKRSRDKSEEKNTKRRKRIIETNDSGSEDIFDNDEETSIVSDDEERTPSPVYVKPLAPKNKRRVAVDRSYVDEEGFMVTRKEYIYESASEDETEKQEKIEEKQPQKKIEAKKDVPSETNTSPKKTKNGKKTKKNVMQNQSTLMNFFKKK